MVKKPQVPAILKSTLKSTFSKPAAARYPDKQPQLPEKYRGQPVFDFNACIGCSLCSRDCPTKAIEMTKVSGKKRPQVNLSKCVFCYQCAETCPKKAINYSCQYELATTDKSTLVVKPKECANP